MEMELTHKTNKSQWVSMNGDIFQYKTNGNKYYNADDTIQVGTYREKKIQ